MTILIIEDEAKLAEILKKALSRERYAVDVSYDGLDGLAKALKSDYALIILDIMLPKMDGIAVCAELRKKGVQTPVIMLTAKGTVEDRVVGLDVGADDYLIKPFGLEELFARVRALLRRRKTADSPVFKLADLVLDTKKHEVTRGGKPLKLPQKQYLLLDTLFRNVGRAMTRRELLTNVWGSEFKESNNELSVHVNYLRKLVDGDQKRPLIHTVRGVGYVLKE